MAAGFADAGGILLTDFPSAAHFDETVVRLRSFLRCLTVSSNTGLPA